MVIKNTNTKMNKIILLFVCLFFNIGQDKVMIDESPLIGRRILSFVVNNPIEIEKSKKKSKIAPKKLFSLAFVASNSSCVLITSKDDTFVDVKTRTLPFLKQAVGKKNKKNIKTFFFLIFF